MEVSIPCFAVVAEDFEGEEGELTLKEGVEVVVVAVDDDGWWTVHTKSDIGIFPGSYLDILEEIPLPSFAEVVKEYPEMNLNVGDIVEIQDISPDGWMLEKDGMLGFCSWEYLDLVTGEAGQAIDDMLADLEDSPTPAAPEPVVAAAPVVHEPVPPPKPTPTPVAVAPVPIPKPQVEAKPEVTRVAEPLVKPVAAVKPAATVKPSPSPVVIPKEVIPVTEEEKIPASADLVTTKAVVPDPAPVAVSAAPVGEDPKPISFPKRMDKTTREAKLEEKRTTKFAAFNQILEEQEKQLEFNPYVMPSDREGGVKFEQEGRWEFHAHEELPPPPPFKGGEKKYVTGSMASFIDWQAKERSAVFDI